MKIVKKTLKSFLRRSLSHRRSATDTPLGGYEVLEPRCLLAADVLQLGVVYTENDLGSDASGDTLEITFDQGVPNTQLTRLILHGDHNDLGFDAGDIVFDVAENGLGADHAFPLTVRELTAQHTQAAVVATVQDGSSSLILEFEHFAAGDRLVVELDVDEVEIALGGTPETRNEGIDPITSGVEFQGVKIVAEFSAPHYLDAGAMGVFRNSYDASLIDSGLDLPADDARGMRDRTAAAFVTTIQTPLPISISGSVFMDLDNDQAWGSEDYGIEDVQIELWKFKDHGYVSTGHYATTNASGAYGFSGLETGIYEVRQVQPGGLIDSAAYAGLLEDTPVGKVINPNTVSEIIVAAGGSDVVQVDFAETDFSDVRGVVTSESDGPLGNVTVTLVCNDGELTRSTVTQENGEYLFEEVLPGSCWVEETTPSGYLDGPDTPGTVNGVAQGQSVDEDRLGPIVLLAGDQAVDYNFTEIRPANLTGVVFQDGDSIVVHAEEQVRFPGNGQLDSDDQRIGNVTLILSNEATGDQQTTRTNSRGEFVFRNLLPGSYMLQEVQPEGYRDGPDYAGTGQGQVDSAQDTIHQIQISAGQTATDYLFSEYQAEIVPLVTPPLDPTPPTSNHGGSTVTGVGTVNAPAGIIQPTSNDNRQDLQVGQQIPIYSGQNTTLLQANAWHLSVIDGGNPRGALKPAAVGQLSMVSTTTLTVEKRWDAATLDSGSWSAVSVFGDAIDLQHVVMGDPSAVPLAGDFNGDGITDVAVFIDGYWFIDINGNGRWDEEDLWARMGNHEDQPVVGDWDGDGKDDIGVFGLQWPGDGEVVEQDPGLPDAANKLQKHVPKNVPPTDAASRRRLLQKSSQGQVRADVVDHVFKYGRQNEIAVAGDWNGDGVVNIGTYRDGQWRLDLNGDGRISEGDEVVSLGSSDDLPVSGDFNGDGIDELGIYRDGTWKLDLNGDRHFDSVDEVFQHGKAGDRPVVGDFDGDGIDDIAVYRANKAG